METRALASAGYVDGNGQQLTNTPLASPPMDDPPTHATSSGRRLRALSVHLSSSRALLSSAASGVRPKRKACIIGHTNSGNYGHGLDMIFEQHPRIVVAAVADADAEGLEEAVKKTVSLLRAALVLLRAPTR